MIHQLDLLFDPPRVVKKAGKAPEYHLGEYRAICLREVSAYDAMPLVDTPEQARDYWKHNIATTPHFDNSVETLALLLLNTRKRLIGHVIGATGTLDTVFVEPRTVFRVAIIVGAAAVIMAHNHPSGDYNPSQADIQVTRKMISAGELLKIDVLDHIVVGKPSLASNKDFVSLRELGCCG